MILALASLCLAVQAPVPLDVMTFNIRYGTANDGVNRWQVRRPRTLEVLKKRHPQLIGLQEALQGQLDDLQKGLKGYQVVGLGREDGKIGGEFSAILFDSKRLQLLRSDTFWLSDTPSVAGSKHWGNGITRICTWAYFRDKESGKFFYHFNTHLDHQSQPAREKGIALILKRIEERPTKDPVVLTGDFNVDETNPVQPQIKAAGYVDTFRVLNPSQTDVCTFNGWEANPKGGKIDYIFVSPVIKTLASEIVRDQMKGFWISDHMPVVAKIELP